jgi:hypothetical protein
MKYIQRVINYLNERLFNLFMFNACKLFIPILYPTYPNDKTYSFEQWLDRLCDKFQVPNDECDKCQTNVLKWLKPCGRQYPRSFYGWHGTMETLFLWGQQISLDCIGYNRKYSQFLLAL